MGGPISDSLEYRHALFVKHLNELVPKIALAIQDYIRSHAQQMTQMEDNEVSIAIIGALLMTLANQLVHHLSDPESAARDSWETLIGMVRSDMQKQRTERGQ